MFSKGELIMSNESNEKKEYEIDPRKLKLKDLSLSGYTVNPLLERGIKTLNDVTGNTKGFYENIKYYRKSSLEELENTLKKYGLDFKEDLFIRPIEDLGLSKHIIKFLKERKINTVGKIINIEKETFKELSKKNATEVLAKMNNFGITIDEMSRLLGVHDSHAYMRIRIKHYPVQDNEELLNDLLPFVASSFMYYTKEFKPGNCRTLYLTSKNRKIEKKEEIYTEVKKITKYLDNYSERFREIFKVKYKACVYTFSQKECDLMFEKVKEHFHKIFEVLEEKKTLFNEITKEMENCTELQLSDINKLKLYFPLVIESEVCRTLLPYTKDEYYIENEEYYEISYENIGEKMKIELKYVAKDMEKTTFSERIKPRERSSYSYSRSSSYYDSSYNSSYDSNSFGEKLRAEIVGTAWFLRGFLPF